MKNFLHTLGSRGISPSSHEALPSSNRPGKPDPSLRSSGLQDSVHERVPTPVCALSLSLGAWWWLTPCSGDKF